MPYLSWVEGWRFGNECGLSIQTSDLFLFEALNEVKEPRKWLTGKMMMIGLRIKETQICTQITNSKTKELYQWFGLLDWFLCLVAKKNSKKIWQCFTFFFSYFEIKIFFFFFQFSAKVLFFKHYFLATSASSVPAVMLCAMWTFSVSELTVETKFIASWKQQETNWLLQKCRDQINYDLKT